MAYVAGFTGPWTAAIFAGAAGIASGAQVLLEEVRDRVAQVSRRPRELDD